MRLGVGDHLRTTGKLLAEPRVPPRSDDFNIRRKSRGGEFETDLIISLAGRTVRDGGSPLSPCDLDHSLGDERPGNAGAEKILTLIECPGLHHGKDKVAGEFFLQIIHLALASASSEGLLFQTVEFLFLTNVGTKRNDFSSVSVFEPIEDHRGVETTRICDNDFFHNAEILAGSRRLRNAGRG